MGWTGRPKNDHLRGPALRDARGVSKLRGDEPHPAVWVRWFRGQESASRARVQGYTARQSDNTSQPGDDTPTHNLAASALPLLRAGALAQSSKTYRVGLVSIGPPESGILSPGMIQNFAKRGYVEGRNIEFERRAAQGKPERLPGFIDELVAKPVDVIVTSSYPAAAAAKERGGKIPIVVINSGDPVATGLAASLAHPGSNITGVSEIATELSAKRLALLKEAVPSVRAVAVLWNADDFGMTLRYQAAEVEAKRAGMLIVPLGVHAPDDFDTAFSEMTKQPPDAILMVTDILTILNRNQPIDFPREDRLPEIYEP